MRRCSYCRSVHSRASCPNCGAGETDQAAGPEAIAEGLVLGILTINEARRLFELAPIGP